MTNLRTFVFSIKAATMKFFIGIFFCFFILFNAELIAQSPCSSLAHQQFDFWVGDWKVYHTQADTLVGQNRIERILNGCVIQENWTGATGFQGKSINTFNPIDSTWNQVWVDVGGATYHFKGKWNQERMLMKGQTIGRNGQVVLFEMSYTPNKTTGHVRQLWKQSSDDGENWAVIFDGIYKKKGNGN